jgi:hypothetical protein
MQNRPYPDFRTKEETDLDVHDLGASKAKIKER